MGIVVLACFLGRSANSMRQKLREETLILDPERAKWPNSRSSSSRKQSALLVHSTTHLFLHSGGSVPKTAKKSNVLHGGGSVATLALKCCYCSAALSCRSEVDA